MTGSKWVTASKVRLAAILVAAAGLSIGVAQAAGDPAAGLARSRSCAACHGANGIAGMPNVPNLAAQNEQYLLKALNDYKSGARKDDMMSLIVQRLTDEDLANLAAYYAGLGAIPAQPPVQAAQ
jgi:cytochrome c553